jgi:hypothetical protein
MKMMKKKPLAEEGGQKVLLVRLKGPPAGQAGHLQGGAEDDGQRKA